MRASLWWVPWMWFVAVGEVFAFKRGYCPTAWGPITAFACAIFVTFYEIKWWRERRRDRIARGCQLVDETFPDAQ